MGALRSLFTPLSAYSFMIFNLFARPASRRSARSAARWAAHGGPHRGRIPDAWYAVSFMVYEFGRMFSGHFAAVTAAAIATLAVFIWLLVRPRAAAPGPLRIAGARLRGGRRFWAWIIFAAVAAAFAPLTVPSSTCGGAGCPSSCACCH